MSIHVTHQLTKTQEEQVRALIALIKTTDGLVREPYLSNNLNFDDTMPSFFLAYSDKEELLGFLTVYADDKEPELLLWVHPQYRRRGIAKQLFECYRDETANYKLEKPFFTIEQHFLDRHPDLPKAWGLVKEDEVEYWMNRDRSPFKIKFRADLTVCQATLEHLEAIAAFQSEAFESPIEESRHYAREGIQDKRSLLYIVLKDNEVLASCTVDTSSGDNYLYGLAVKASARGQGIGTYMTQWIINDRIANDERPFQIAVEAENSRAKRLYERLGFETAAEVTFLR